MTWSSNAFRFEDLKMADGKWRSQVTVFIVAGLCSFAVLPFWLLPWVVTQDGPAHAYNAHVIMESLWGDGNIASAHVVHWRPLPNWGGHVVLVTLLTVLPLHWIEPVMASITLIGVAFSVLWLHRRVNGAAVPPIIGVMIALLALNQFWLLGFHSFLLGIPVAALALGLHWEWRERLDWRHMIALGGLQVVAYFSHAVPWGFLVVALCVQGAFAPGSRPINRLVRTMACLAPSAVLAGVYLTYARALSPMTGSDIVRQPYTFSLREVVDAIDFVTLKSKTALPFVDQRASWFAALTPLVWVGAAGVLFILQRVCREPGSWISRHRSWLILALLMFAFACGGPSGLGGHGGYLSARLMFLGTLALIPALGAPTRRIACLATATTLGVAAVMQYSLVWEYAMASSRRVAALLETQPYVGQKQRIIGFTLERRRFQADPMVHAADLLGIGTDNVVWSNYEAGQYQFPVKFRQDRSWSPLFMMSSQTSLESFREYWRDVILDQHREIDVIVMYGRDEEIERINNTAYDRVIHPHSLRVQVFRHRPEAVEQPSQARGRPVANRD